MKYSKNRSELHFQNVMYTKTSSVPHMGKNGGSTYHPFSTCRLYRLHNIHLPILLSVLF
jgi:hypothetical protein